jgi:hypothetical protein
MKKVHLRFQTITRQFYSKEFEFENITEVDFYIKELVKYQVVKVGCNFWLNTNQIVSIEIEEDNV